MTLLECFRIVTRFQEATSQESLDEALETIYREFQVIAARLPMRHEISEESASRAFLRLVQGGPRSVSSEAAVRPYVRAMVHHSAIDWFRGERRFVDLPDPSARPGEASCGLVSLPSPTPNPEESLLDEESRRLFLWAYDYVFRDVATVLRDRRPERYRSSFERGAAQLRALAMNEAEFDDLVVAEHGELTVTTKERVYKQHSRVRRAFVEWLQDEEAAPRLTQEQLSLVGAVVNLMRR